jgi:shikimate dehydrogenase
MNLLDKDTQLCVSFSSNPSNHGVRFHNFLYAELGLNFVYKPFAPNNIEQAIGAVRSLPIRGASVSMPFKEAVIPLVDEVLPSAAAIGAVNTIVNDQGLLRASNTDYTAVQKLISNLDRGSVIVSGSGGMAKAVASALRDGGFTDGLIVARNESTGRALAEKLGWAWQSSVGDAQAQLLVNVTPVGMEGASDPSGVPFAESAIQAASTIFDVVAKPIETPLIKLARQLGKAVITGGEVIALQAAEQFEIYTGVKLTEDLVRRARAYAQGLS